MQHILKGYRGMALLLNLNWDRILYLATLVVALYAGALLGTFW
ncbi:MULTISPECIES: hypothetical protein [Roseovarius]|uniref:Uncharacterized protein n=2 Tax=Roseovarius TaxID=74030 RepID=A0ABZ2HIH8_9RHOB|nr:hypothetical protein [Roseovarius sp. W115]